MNGIYSAAFCESAALRSECSPSQALTRQLPQGDDFWLYRKVCHHRESRPLGEGGLTRSGKTEGVVSVSTP